jgi:hypothetical protein
MSLWRDIKPRLKRQHHWHFAYYLETPSERRDSHWYQAFLFRDNTRSQFGRLEFLGPELARRDFEKMAARVITDDEFRHSLLSDDPELATLWKRH